MARLKSMKRMLEEEEKERRKRERRLNKEMRLQKRIQEETSAAFERGANAGFDKGVREATNAVRMQSFADLSNAWGQLHFAHRAAASYADVVARMYSAQTNVKKEDKGETPVTA